MSWNKSLLTLIIFSGYLLLGIVIPSHMGHMAEHGMPMETCPYLPFQQTSDDTLWSHLVVWQSLMLVLLPVLVILKWIHTREEVITQWLFLTQGQWHQFLREHPPRPPFPILFSQGILHPKAP